MDRKIVLIIVGAAAAIGLWALGNFVLWPEPKVSFDILVNGNVLGKADLATDAEGKPATDVLTLAAKYAYDTITLRIKQFENADSATVTVSGKDPVEVLATDPPEKRQVVLTTGLRDDLSRQQLTALVVEVVANGRGGQTKCASIPLAVAAGPASRPASGPAGDEGTASRPASDGAVEPAAAPAPAVPGASFHGAPAPGGAVGGDLVLGTNSNTERDANGHLLYPIQVQFTPVGASITTLKLTGYPDSVPPTIWVGGGKPPEPQPYSLLNPIRPIEKEAIYSSTLCGIALYRYGPDYSDLDEHGKPRDKFTALDDARMKPLAKIGKIRWHVPEGGVEADEAGVPVRIRFEADVVYGSLDGPAPDSRPAGDAGGEKVVLHLRKTYWIERGGYEVFCTVEAENRLMPADAESLGLPAGKLCVQIVHTGGIGVPGGDLRYSRRLAVGVMEGGKIKAGDIPDLDAADPKATEEVTASLLGQGCFPCGGGSEKGKPFTFAVENKLLGPLPEPDAGTYKIIKVPFRGGKARWAGVYNKYFAELWIPRHLKLTKAGEGALPPQPGWPLDMPETGDTQWLKDVELFGARESTASKTANYGVRFTTTEFELPYADATGVGGRAGFTFSILGFPKRDDLFDRYTGANLEIVRESQGSCFCTIPYLDQFFGWILKGLAVVTFGNYGIAIILLVIVIRVILFPLSRKGQLSMMKMQKVAPKLEELKKKYKDDRQGMQQAQMALYREYGISPFGSCLPMFIQIPIWVALWMSLSVTIELRHAPLLPFWITDLAGPDALISWGDPVRIPLLDIFWGGQDINSFNLLPILMAVVMYLQQQMTPKPDSETDQQAQQRKMMKWMMLLFPIMLYTAPSGLNLYIMTSTAIGLAETRYLRKHLADLEARGELFKPKTGKSWMQKMLERAQSLHDGPGGGKGGSKSGGKKDWRAGGGRRQ